MGQENAFQASVASLTLEGRCCVRIMGSGHPSEYPPGTFALCRHRSDEMPSTFFVHFQFVGCHVPHLFSGPHSTALDQ
jgi:hypothetical protein